MKALILAGGLGLRIRNIVSDRPKSMGLIGKEPFLAKIIRQLKENGIRKIILATGYKSGVIESYFGDGNNFGVEIKYSKELQPLGTAGAIKNAEHLLEGENFFVLNGDTWSDLDYEGMKNYHKE
jgi:NDP-sugar pyrophosphorylase family protein